MRRRKIKFGEKVSIKFTLDERDLILNNTLAWGYLIDPLKIAPMDKNKINALYSIDDLKELNGYIAAESNHCEDFKLQKKLDKLFERLSKIEQSYILEE